MSLNLEKLFEEKSSQRYLRDDLVMCENCNNLFREHEHPVVEELKLYTCKKDPRIVLLTRDLFDYLACLEHPVEKCNNLERRTVAEAIDSLGNKADLSSFDFPFDFSERDFLFYSQYKDGTSVFTVNLRYEYNGGVLMTADETKVGRVLMTHETKNWIDLFRSHLNTQLGNGVKSLTELGEHENARLVFDNVIKYSESFGEE